MIVPLIIIAFTVKVSCLQEHHHYENDAVKLIDRLNNFFDFDHNVFLVDNSIDSNSFSKPINNGNGKLRAQTVFKVDMNAIVVKTEQKQLPILKSLSSKNAFVIVIAEAKSLMFDHNMLLSTYLYAIRLQKGDVKFGVHFVDNVTSVNKITEFFTMCSQKIIENIYVTFYSNIQLGSTLGPFFNVFRFDPFLFEYTKALINLTGSDLIEKNFPGKLDFSLNMRDTEIRLFEYMFGPNESPFKSENQTYEKKKSIDPGTVNKTYNYSVAEMDIVLGNDISINPVRIQNYILLVPHAKPYTGFVSYLQNNTWGLLFALTLIVILAASSLLTVSVYLKTKKFLLIQCVVDVINLLLNNNEGINYSRLKRADVWVVVPLTFTGLIVVNGIFSVFQSYLTLPIYERQIKSVEDLYESPVPILAPYYYWYHRLIDTLDDVAHRGGWTDKVHKVDFDCIEKELGNFNNSAAFLVSFDDGQRYLERQKRLNIKSLKALPDISLPHSYIAIQRFKGRCFFEILNDILHRLESGGFVVKWIEQKYRMETKQIWKNNPDVKFNNSGDSKDNVEVSTVLWYGWSVSIIAFICEILWKKSQKLRS